VVDCAYWTKVQYTDFQIFARVRACKCKTTTTARNKTFRLAKQRPHMSSSEIIMALNRQHVGMAVYSVLRWLQCRPIRAGPSVFEGQ